MPIFPDPDLCRAIHHLLLDGDRTASARLFTLMNLPLVGWLRARRRTTDPEAICDAATDALVDYIKNPDRWDPLKGTLPAYLCMAAERDLLNAIDKIRRIKAREIRMVDVEDQFVDRNVTTDVEPESDAAEGLLLAIQRYPISPIDKEIVALMLKGERSTEVFARVLGIEQRPASEQRREVKRHKDRLKKVIQRSREPRDAR